MKRILIIAMLVLILLVFSGCWNYREINELSIVAGLGIDMDATTGEVVLYIELADISGESKEIQPVSKLLVTRGKTIFDAVRNAIAISGKRLYWADAQIMIISEQMAQNGLVSVLDWFMRDQELRSTIDVIIANGSPVIDFFLTTPLTNKIFSFEIRDKGMNQKSMEKAPKMEVYTLLNLLDSESHAVYAPCITIQEENGIKMSVLSGMAVFKNDKLIGFLDGDDTKYFLYAINKIEGGLLVKKEVEENKAANVSLEVFQNSTIVSPDYSDGKLIIKISIKTDAAIAETGTETKYTDEKGREVLKEEMQTDLSQNIQRVIKKVQDAWGVDVFGFSSKINNTMPDIWEQIEPDWGKIFPNIEVTVESKINLRNSAKLIEPLEATQ